MGEKIAFKNGRISDFRGLVTMTLTLDRVILVMHHSSTSTYIPNFTAIEKTFCGRSEDSYLMPTSKSRDTKTRKKFKKIKTTGPYKL